MYLCVCIYVCIHILREREREIRVLFMLRLATQEQGYNRENTCIMCENSIKPMKFPRKVCQILSKWSVPVLSSNLSQSYIIKVGLHSDIRCPVSDCINLCPAGNL